MTTQAKNRILAYIVLGMLAVIAIVGSKSDKAEQPETATVMIPTEVPTLVTIETPSYDVDEFECMRANLYFEAGNQSNRGMQAVALVTLNRTRTKHYPSSVCEVVKDYKVVRGRKVCQFSWYCDGKSDRPRLHNLREQEAWDRATEIAAAALEGKIDDFLGRATHYHANYVNPKWANVPQRYRRIATVGTHIFYRDVALKLKHNA